jgi:glutathione S-transferase
MYKLYYSKGACSLAIHVVLNEIGSKFELINAKNSDGSKSTEILKVNPRGAVPVLEIDGFILKEGVAILTYLLDNNANSLLPKEGLKRAKALEWLCFANATLHPAYSRLFFARAVLGEKASQNDLYAPSIKAIQNYWNEIEKHLTSNQYLCGDDFTVADILVTVIANWSGNFKGPINFGEKTKDYFSRVIARPAFAKALTAEDVVYQVNK